MADKKNIVELLAVVVEFCATVERANKVGKKTFVEKTHKLLSLLYLKASVLSSSSEIDDYCEKFVTENDWEQIRQAVETILGEHDSQIEIVEPDSFSSGDRVNTCISECFADIYQDARNFAEQCKDTTDEMMEVATSEFILNYKFYWGTRA